MTPLERTIIECSGIDEAELDTETEERIEITEWDDLGEPVGATK